MSEEAENTKELLRFATKTYWNHVQSNNNFFHMCPRISEHLQYIRCSKKMHADECACCGVRHVSIRVSKLEAHEGRHAF